MVPSTTVPTISASLANAAGSNVLTKPGKYSTLEQLLEDKLVCEVHTLGGVATAAAG
jgi:hypothetical protein